MATGSLTLDARTWRRWTTECRLVLTDVTQVAPAFVLANDLMDEIETAIDRYQPASEISRLQQGPNAISPMLAAFLEAGLEAAWSTDGLVDPTVGAVVPDLDAPHPRYPQDLGAAGAEVRTPLPTRLELWGNTVTLGAGVGVDLGSTGKALAADLIARRIHQRLGTGVLVSLGGDIATGGAGPVGGWQVEVGDAAADPCVRFSLVPGAAVATSSTLHRRWMEADGEPRHHLIDPRTGRSADGPWRTATVVAPTCVAANTASTAAIIHGPNAVSWLTDHGLPARLVDHDGAVATVNGFPEEEYR